jgi:hypothetical protein
MVWYNGMIWYEAPCMVIWYLTRYLTGPFKIIAQVRFLIIRSLFQEFVDDKYHDVVMINYLRPAPSGERSLIFSKS